MGHVATLVGLSPFMLVMCGRAAKSESESKRSAPSGQRRISRASQSQQWIPADTRDRDVVTTSTVVDWSLCAQESGVVRAIEIALPLTSLDPSTILFPKSLVLGTFRRYGDKQLWVAAAVHAPVLELQLLSSWGVAVEGNMTNYVWHADLHRAGRELPFLIGDCFGWSHDGGHGLAYADATGSSSVLQYFAATTPWQIGTILDEQKAAHARRTYAISITTRLEVDPFQCWTNAPIGAALTA